MLGSKKMGRPTANPKDISLKVRLDKTTAGKLDECIRELGVSKAEVVRRGVHKVHDDLEKNEGSGADLPKQHATSPKRRPFPKRTTGKLLKDGKTAQRKAA